MSSLILYTLEFIKHEGRALMSMDIEIDLGEDFVQPAKPLLRADPRRFLLQVFSEFLDRKMVSCYKYVV